MSTDHFARIRVLFHDQRRYDLAERELKEHPKLLVGNAEAHMMLGVCAFERKEFGEARLHLKKALEIDPEYANAFYWLAVAAKSLSEKEDLAREAIRLRTAVPEYHALLAHVLFDRNRIKSALLEIDKALSIDPDNGYSLRIKASILIHRNKKSEAIVALDRALLLNPLDAQTHVLLHLAKARSSPRDAERHLKMALQLAPDDPDIVEHCLAVRARRAEVARKWLTVKICICIVGLMFLIGMLKKSGNWIQ